uniref:Carboxylesterase type B domain-containing protein n=1 Tax=Scylla olivacea TaxID=85551 RepID=A0A0P4WAE1_SCYOL
MKYCTYIQQAVFASTAQTEVPANDEWPKHTKETQHNYQHDHVLNVTSSQQRGPTLPLNELVYVFGAPLGSLGPLSAGLNFTNTEVTLSEAVITMWTNFIKTG